jgi:hypothetical protein
MTQRNKATDGATQYTGALVSPHVIAKPDGSRIWRDQVITTSGPALYSMSEIDPDSGSREMVTCIKPIEEVTSRGFLASLEGAPILLRHGSSFIDKYNWRDRSVGHTQNARESTDRDANGNVQIIADLHVKDAHGIDMAESILRGISAAYTYEIEPTEDPKVFIQTNLRANHVALVDRPRMESARLTDSENEEIEVDTTTMNRLCDLLEKLLAMLGVKAETDARDPDQIPMVGSEPGKGAAPKRFADLTPVDALSKKERSTNPLGSDDSVDISSMIATLQGGSEVGDTMRCYDSLRLLKNQIAASGDLGLILGYNRAMTQVKAQLGSLVTKLPTGRAIALDTRTDQGSRGEFEESCAALRAKLLGEATENDRDPNKYYRRVSLGRDASKADNESYESQCKRVREKMLSTRP